MVTLDQIRRNEAIKTYITKADEQLRALGYTEHAFAHVGKSSALAGELLRQLGYDGRTCELAEIAGYLHDIGNAVNRVNHAQSGALMAFQLLERMGMDAGEIAEIVAAIGNHDEGTAYPVNAVAAALILADKSDVRRSRVRNRDIATFDIHDRVNYAVEEARLLLERERGAVELTLTIDTGICAVMDYFEIFLGRMMLCRRAANFFELKFALVINGMSIL